MRALTPGQVRRAAVAAQRLDRPHPAAVTAGHVARLVEHIGLLQIDSVNVLARAHLLPVLARLGPYDVTLLDRLAGRPPRRLVEYWAHEASFVPVETYRLLHWRMERHRERNHWGRELASHPGVLVAVRELVAEHGPVTAAQVHELLGHCRGPKDGWGWNWTPAKHALEHLFDVGEIVPAHRTAQFERAYDLTERVLPAGVRERPAPDERTSVRELVAIAARALGVADASALADYFRLPVAATREAAGELVRDGTLEEVRVEGQRRPVLRHVGARLPRRTEARALLAPFDPLVFDRRRLLQTWGMHYRIGIYTPAAQRTHGYYVLPFLLGEHLVARVDLKADRATGVLRVRAAHAEDPGTVPGLPAAGPGAWPSRADVLISLALTMAETARWLGLGEVVTDPDAAGDLAEALRRRPAG